MNTNFHMCARVNTLAGNNADVTDFKGHGKQANLIRDEWREGAGNFHNIVFNRDALRDDVQDILFTAYGMAHRLGMDWESTRLGDSDSNWETICAGEVIELTAKPEVYMNTMGELLDGMCNHFNRLTAPSETTPRDMQAVKVLLANAYALAHVMGYPADADFLEVVRSNMTKFDKSVSDAQLTIEKYEAVGVKVTITPATYVLDGQEYLVHVTKVPYDQVSTDGKEYPAGKWLKSVHFEEPVYQNIDNVAPVTYDANDDGEVRITITGVQGAGLSHISSIIAHSLAASNFNNITIKDLDGQEGFEASMVNVKSIVEADWNRPTVSITQLNVVRPGNAPLAK